MVRSHLSIFTQIALVVGICVIGDSPAAEPAAAKAAAKLLLEKGWDKTPAARQLVDATDVESPKLQGDALVLAAHWLVLMHQGRFPEALPSVQAFIKSQGANASGLSAMRAEVWVHTAKHDYRPAISAADRLGQAATPNPPATDKAALAAQEEAIAFLGRFAGFLEGPAEQAADQELRKNFEQRLIARLTEAQKKQFDEARSSVVDQHANLMKGATGAGDAAKTTADAEKQEKLEKLSKEKEQLAKEESKIDNKAKELADERKQKLADLDREDALRVTKLAGLQNQLNSIMPQYNQEKAVVDRAQQKVDNEQNPQLRQQLQNDARRAQDNFNNSPISRQVDNLKFQVTTVTQERLGIQQNKNLIMGGAAVQGQLLENQRQGIEFDKFKNENKQKRAEKAKAAAASGKAAALENKAHAFGTYDEFPLQELRDKLLSKLR